MLTIPQFGAIVISGFGFSNLKALLIQMPVGATQLVFLLLTSSLASLVPSSRLVLMTFNTLTSMAGIIMVYECEGRAARMAGLCLGSVFAANIPLSLSLISSNVGGFTKRSVTTATLFVAYCIGNIVGPQFFLASQKPRYEVSRSLLHSSHKTSVNVSAFWLRLASRRHLRGWALAPAFSFVFSCIIS
jgi:hypothetical protein